MKSRMRAIEITQLLERTELFGRLPQQLENVSTFDAIEIRELGNPCYDAGDDADAHIGQNLKHIPVNPSKKHNSELIKSSYVFANNMQNDEVGLQETAVVNHSESSAKAFLDILIERAELEREVSIRGPLNGMRDASKAQVYYLTGDRGAGKTFFLNYLLTSSDAYLQENKVIWVRANLLYRTQFDENILDWMLAQALKICLRYYDSGSSWGGKKCVDIIGHLRAWIAEQELSQVARVGLEESLHRAITVFQKIGSDQPINKDNCNEILAREIFRFLREEGYSFIFVIDGLDVLDISPDQVLRFRRLRDAVDQFIPKSVNVGASILVCTRNETMDNQLAVESNSQNQTGNRFFIEEPNFRTVVDRRMKSIYSFISSFPEGVIRSRLSRVLRDFSKVVQDSFELYEGGRYGDLNLRAKTHCLYLEFIHFVDRKIGQGYRIIEQMLLQGHRYPVVPYRFHRKDDVLFARLTSAVKHEARFIPLLLRAPMDEGDAEDPYVTAASGIGGGIMIGFRILQLLREVERFGGNSGRLSIKQIADILVGMFDYRRDAVIASIFQLSAFELVRVAGSPILEADDEGNEVGYLKKGEMFLSDVLFDIAYLNMMAMRVRFTDSSGELVKVVTLGGVASNSLRDWVKAKLTNSYLLFSYCLIADRLEREAASKRLALLPKDELSQIKIKLCEVGSLNFKSKIESFAVDVMKVVEADHKDLLSDDDVEAIMGHFREVGSKFEVNL